MPKLKEKLDNIKSAVFEIALIPVDFFLNPIALYFLRRANLRRRIAKDISISSEWIRFEIQPPVKIKNKNQAILLGIKDCWKDLHGKNLKLSDGTIINPQVEISDESGNTYYLKPGMSFGMPDTELQKWIVSEAAFRYSLPKDKTYTEVRVRSSEPFLCELISWNDYNLK